MPEVLIKHWVLDIPDDDDRYSDFMAVELMSKKYLTRAAIALTDHLNSTSQTLAKLDEQRELNARGIMPTLSSEGPPRETDTAPAWETQRNQSIRRILAGEDPSSWAWETQGIFQDAYILSLVALHDAAKIAKELVQGAASEPLIDHALVQFIDTVGDVTQVRNTVAHPEDWYRGRALRKDEIKPIPLKPIDRAPAVVAPAGALIRYTDNGDTISVTGRSGALKDVRISLEALLAATELVYTVLNAMPRRSSPEVWLGHP